MRHHTKTFVLLLVLVLPVSSGFCGEPEEHDFFHTEAELESMLRAMEEDQTSELSVSPKNAELFESYFDTYRKGSGWYQEKGRFCGDPGVHTRTARPYAESLSAWLEEHETVLLARVVRVLKGWSFNDLQPSRLLYVKSISNEVFPGTHHQEEPFQLILAGAEIFVDGVRMCIKEEGPESLDVGDEVLVVSPYPPYEDRLIMVPTVFAVAHGKVLPRPGDFLDSATAIDLESLHLATDLAEDR